MDDILDKPQGSPGVRDNSNRARLAMNLLLTTAIISGVQAISGYLELSLLQGVSAGNGISMREANASDLRQTVIGFINIGVIITCAILFIQWFRRAYANLGRAGIETQNGDSMAVWGFIIPFMNLFKPYQIAREIASETRQKAEELAPEHRSTVKIPLIILWWILFLIANMIANSAFRMSLGDDQTLSELITISKLGLLSAILDIPAALLACYMIKQISKDEAVLYQYQHKTAAIPAEEQF